MYSFDSRIRFSEVNETGELGIASIINYFQDCSLFHSEEVGLGLSHFQRHKKIWFLCSWQLKINRFPKVYEKITISTYPYSFKGGMGYRNFKLTDETGAICAIADSSWVYMNLETNKPARVTPEDSEPFGLDEKLDMDYASGKLLIPENMDKLEPIPVLPSYIDSNHHVNNGQYVRIAQDYLPENFKPSEIRVEYRNAAKLGDLLYPCVNICDKICVVSLTDADGKPFANMEFVS